MESKSSHLKTNHIYFTIAAVAALGLTFAAAYYLSTSFSRSSSKSSCIGFIPWNATQEDKDKVARAWMERYVRTVLLKGRGRSTDKRNKVDETEKAAGTLQRLIATEKGLLKLEDFEHL